MRVLVAHNFYQRPGGEDGVFRRESQLLEQHGHEVEYYIAHNDEIKSYGIASFASLASKTIWNRETVRSVRALMQRSRPDVLHVHNTFPLISPAIYEAAHLEGVPVVQTLHNYRLMCPEGAFRRRGKVCEDCVDTSTFWPGVVHGCYHDSRAQSGVVAAMLATHRLLGTWRHKVSRYIALSQFAKDKFVEGGFLPEQIVIKPNFCDYRGGVSASRGSHVLFVGRLSAEKGLTTLLGAVARMSDPPLLRVAGDGPLMRSEEGPRIDWLGHRSTPEVVDLMSRAAVMVVPSVCYEGGTPLTLLEAFATGTPVIASAIGTLGEVISDGETGLLVPPGDSAALAERLHWALHHPEEMRAIGLRGREEFECKYTPERNHQALMEIYRGVMT
jgi:glycosyltransferase involved in cell wall biosynthesis